MIVSQLLLYHQVQYPWFAEGVSWRVWNIKLFDTQTIGNPGRKLKTFDIAIKQVQTLLQSQTAQFSLIISAGYRFKTNKP